MLQGLAGKMQGICKGAGAPVLELHLPEEEEEEDEDEEDQDENMDPNAVAVKPEQQVWKYLPDLCFFCQCSYSCAFHQSFFVYFCWGCSTNMLNV